MFLPRIFYCSLPRDPNPPDKRVLVLYSNIRGLQTNLDELAVARSDYDVLVCTESKLGSDHCLVSCVLRVELSVPGYNVRSTVFLKHRTNGTVSADCGAVRTFTWSIEVS